MSGRTLRLVAALAIVVAVGVLVVVNEAALARYFRPPWMSQCERLDHRCKDSGNLRDAMVCGVSGLASLGGRSEEACAKANEMLDERK